MYRKNLVNIAQDKVMTFDELFSNIYIRKVLSYDTQEKRFESKHILQRSLLEYYDYFYRLTYTNPVSQENQTLLVSENTMIYAVNRREFVPINELTLHDVLKINTRESQRVYACSNCGDHFTSHQLLAGHYTWCDDEIRHKTLKRQREFYQDNPEKLIERKGRFIKARGYPISALERWVLALEFPEVVYVGKGDFGIEIATNKHCFPDFVVAGEQKLIEVGDVEYWHDHNEIRQRIRDYKDAGYDCLYLTSDDIYERPVQTEARIATFLYNHDVAVEAIERQKGGMRSPHRYALGVEDHNCYFANGVLVSSGV